MQHKRGTVVQSWRASRDRLRQAQLPTSRALWRLADLGLLELRREPGNSIDREDAHAMLDYAVEQGWWEPDRQRWRKPKPMPPRLMAWLEECDSQQAKSESGTAA
jgi:hypothetical protein